MSLEDVTFTCSDCNQPFPFTVREMMFYASKNIINPPNRCPGCRAVHKVQKAQQEAQRNQQPLTKQLTCQDCQNTFEFSPGEQQYYASHSLNDPTRCKPCRDKRKTAATSTPVQPRKMYDAICADCGNATQVPFQPIPGRQIYCRSCYPAHKR